VIPSTFRDGLVAEEVFGKYQLVRPLAQGGMAELFLARQSGPAGFEKQVVIKRVLPQLTANQEFVHMFLDEARLAARLSHPNIVQIFDFGEAGGTYFLAMEYLSGEDLDTIATALSARRRAFPGPIAALIVSSACEALHYAHTCADDLGRPLHIVHRDISPSNLFVTYQGAVKVLDFGIAKAEGKLVHTQSGVIKGKLLYMSPEQILGKPIDARSDIFSLGAVLHELLTGQTLFERSSAMDMLKAITEEPIARPSAVVHGVPAELEAVAMRALERDPGARWQSAREMRAALDAYIAQGSSAPAMSQLQDFLQELMGESRIQQRLRPPSNPSRPDPAFGFASAAAVGAGSTTLRGGSPGLAGARGAPGSHRVDRSAQGSQRTTPGPATAPASQTPQAPINDELAGAPPAPALSEDAAVFASDAAAAGMGKRRPWKVMAGAVGALAVLGLVGGWAALRSPKTEQNLDALIPLPPPVPDSIGAGALPTPRQIPASKPGPPPKPGPGVTSRPERARTESLAAARPDRARAERSGTPNREPSKPPVGTARPAKASTAEKTGTLDLNCIPWCHIYVDGNDSNLDSPARGIVLGAGSHRLRVVNPPSGKRQERTVEIKAGRAVQEVIRF
jgi:serine/threonine-protein kinase